jgi:ABC-2 type transport system ATP-binding protein
MNQPFWADKNMGDAPQPADCVIKVRNLKKNFAATPAVDGIDFDIMRGQTVGLLGGNGAGKTTTLSILLGLLTPTSGEIRVLGHDMAQNRFAALARMNFSSPYVELPHRLTVYENLRIYGLLYSVAALDDRIAELSADLNLTEFLHRKAGKLSAGQKTRAVLAKSLLNKPELLLLDEPTASLDPDTADWVRGYLERYRTQSGGTILLASHNMGEVERLCQNILMMKRGKIVDRGSPQELIQKYGHTTLEQVFLDIARTEEAA